MDQLASANLLPPEKPLNLQFFEAKNHLINEINELLQHLPFWLVEIILRDIHKEVLNQADKEFQQARTAYLENYSKWYEQEKAEKADQ